MRLMGINYFFTGGESYPRFGESQIAFATIGEGLTNAQTLNLNTRIETFQTALSRSVNPPSNTVAPVISGTQEVGQTLSATNGTWTGAETITFTYQWKKNGSNIGGATSQTYLLVAGDLGAKRDKVYDRLEPRRRGRAVRSKDAEDVDHPDRQDK